MSLQGLKQILKTRSGFRALIGAAKLVVAFCALSFVAQLLTLEDSNAAARDWWWAKTRGGKKKWSFTVESGVTYFTKYNLAPTLASPPKAVLVGGAVNAIYKGRIGVSVSAGFDVGSTGTSLIGVGVRLPFLSFSGGNRSFVSALAMQILADYVFYSTNPPVAPFAYATSDSAFRFGGSMVFAFGQSGIHLNTMMQVTTLSGNFMITPFIGFGYEF